MEAEAREAEEAEARAETPVRRVAREAAVSALGTADQKMRALQRSARKDAVRRMHSITRQQMWLSDAMAADVEGTDTDVEEPSSVLLRSSCATPPESLDAWPKHAKKLPRSTRLTVELDSVRSTVKKLEAGAMRQSLSFVRASRHR